MWHWKYIKTVHKEYPVPDEENFQILPNGNLEIWGTNVAFSNGILAEVYPTVDGECYNATSPFGSTGINPDYSYFGPGAYTESIYSVTSYDISSTRYFTFVRRNKAGVTQGSRMYHYMSAASTYSVTGILEISTTHIVIVLQSNFFGVNSTRSTVVTIPSTIATISIPLPNPQTTVPYADARLVNHQSNYHSTDTFSAGKKIYFCSTISGTITDAGDSPWAGDTGLPRNNLNVNYPDSWVEDSVYVNPNYTMTVTSMDGEQVSTPFVYPFRQIINSGLPNEYAFTRSRWYFAAPPTTTFPVFGNRDTTEIVVPNQNGVYSFLNPATEWNVDACELFAYYSPAYYYDNFAYIFWYIDRNNVYCLTRDADRDTDEFDFAYSIWKYIGIGTMSAGPTSVTSFRTTNRYGR